jgi:hypothetical protein
LRRIGGTSRLVAIPYAGNLGFGDYFHGVRRSNRLFRALVFDAKSVTGSAAV